ncbi:MAG TPA: hypothetical protein VHG08_15685 [Longimicrobium sp.]|nr:hypothetical protein [Longimicrobium sp.]
MHTDTATRGATAAAELDPGFRGALPPVVAGEGPALVVGETPEVVREHDWPANLFVVLSYVAAVGLAASAVGSVGWTILSGDLDKAGWAVVAGVWAALQWRLAGEVEHFSRWGWYGAMMELSAAAAAKVWMMTQGNWVGAAVGLVLDLLWMDYFWERRDQFDVDVEL